MWKYLKLFKLWIVLERTALVHSILIHNHASCKCVCSLEKKWSQGHRITTFAGDQIFFVGFVSFCLKGRFYRGNRKDMRRGREKERDAFLLFFHSPNDLNSQSWDDLLQSYYKGASFASPPWVQSSKITELNQKWSRWDRSHHVHEMWVPQRGGLPCNTFSPTHKLRFHLAACWETEINRTISK